jgi:hypothetical protein
MELFESTKRRLYDILKDVKSGKIQLPDFQRGWIWDDYRIKGLLASIAKSFPIGAVMLLETGNRNVRFKTRLVESVVPTDEIEDPEELILDGQQRLTSLYQTIFSNRIVKTINEKKHEIKRWYYIDIKKAMDATIDFEEAIISINDEKKITRDFGRELILDLSKEEFEYELLMYPVHMIDEYSEWRRKFNQHWNHDSEKSKLWDAFEAEVISHFTHYQLPVIRLKKENTKEAVCQVFEKVNTGGVSLNVFELLTATYAMDSFDLRENWSGLKKELNTFKVLYSIENTDFLQATTLISTYDLRQATKREGKSEDKLPAISCKRKEVLNLSLPEYKKWHVKIKDGFIKAAKLLNEHYLFKADDLPYTSQLVPLSAIFAVLGEEAENITIKNKIMQWFWCGVMGELYGGANETRYALDLQQLVSMIKGEIDENNVKTIYEASFNPSRLNTLRTRNSAAYKGIYTLLINHGAKDWINGQGINITNYFSENIDIHHIFPKIWCEKNNISRNDYDCIINKTPLSFRTNRIIGGVAPSKYLEKIEEKLQTSNQGVKDLLQTHLIDGEAMYADDFKIFFEKRKENLIGIISRAMGKPLNIPQQNVAIDNDEFDEADFDSEIVNVSGNNN